MAHSFKSIKVTVTDEVLEVSLGQHFHIELANDGGDSVRFHIEQTLPYVGVPDNCVAPLYPGENIVLDSLAGFLAVHLLCKPGEQTEVRIYAWD